MIKVKFYLDKADKNRRCPVHLVMRKVVDKVPVQIKVSTGEKIKKKDWDHKNQIVKDTDYNYRQINKFLSFLQQEVEKYIELSPHSHFTDKKIKEKISSLIEARKENYDVKIVTENAEYLQKQKVTFIDLFAGAGGFSEGFLQAETDTKCYEFILASDINENCELTHIARYNYQLQLDTIFLKKDITEHDFIEELTSQLKGATIDVVCGGPPCQSFSLAGARRKFDKKDDLFHHYLHVIQILRPKYFIMENVKGILTKENGRIKEMILEGIKSIIDLKEFNLLLTFLVKLKKVTQNRNAAIIELYIQRLLFENFKEHETDKLKERYISNIESKFKYLTPKIVDYKTSKTDIFINTIRHGFNLLRRIKDLNQIKKKVIIEKSINDLDNDFFAPKFDEFLTSIDSVSIIEQISISFTNLKPNAKYQEDINEIKIGLEIYNSSFDECINGLRTFVRSSDLESEFDEILNKIRLYKIDQPFIALASNYGVPQNRERVLFIGCRKDQKIIKTIPPTTNDRVTVYEALFDLDYIGNDEEKFDYEDELLKVDQENQKLIKRRSLDGKPISNRGLTYAEWSRKGRLNGRFTNIMNPFYVRDKQELENNFHTVANLHNHKTSKQNEKVVERLNVILETGDYSNSKERLTKLGLDSDKRNYNILRPNSQSPTVMTIADDYIHYNRPRALTVREMARLQSFDDSFVFQGKRSTGGNKRKYEVPQFTLVGNAIPPLMARAIGLEILKHIK